MNIQMKRVLTVSTMTLALTVVGSSAFAMGRHKHHGYNSWTKSSSSATGGTAANCPPASNDTGDDSNPVPEPSSVVMLGSALAGVGYRMRQRFLGK